MFCARSSLEGSQSIDRYFKRYEGFARAIGGATYQKVDTQCCARPDVTDVDYSIRRPSANNTVITFISLSEENARSPDSPSGRSAR